MKKSFKVIAILFTFISLFSCKKDEPVITAVKTYTSINALLAAMASPMQQYTINSTLGGSFTTPQGTVVTIPPHAFKKPMGDSVFGDVVINFKDVYKKSDMMLNELHTCLATGEPMKSAGMFYIKALQGTTALDLIYGNVISVAMPSFGLPIDSNMIAYRYVSDGGAKFWSPSYFGGGSMGFGFVNGNDSAGGYLYNLIFFSPPLDSGSWYNCDNPVFASYPKTNLILIPPADHADYSIKVFLFFNDFNAMTYPFYNETDFVSYNAPVGCTCTAVAVGLKDHKLYSSFTLLTISSNLSVNFQLSETTEAEFKAQLLTLD